MQDTMARLTSSLQEISEKLRREVEEGDSLAKQHEAIKADIAKVKQQIKVSFLGP
jgi:predicted nuclease with TOPRIM domain